MTKTVLSLLICLGSLTTFASDEDWPYFLGPNLTLGLQSQDTLQPGEDYRLKLGWKVDTGSGYSAVSVADGLLYTSFSDGSHDVAVALDTRNGKEVWRYQIADTFLGLQGSEDGPLSTPAVAGDKVFIFGPKGHLAALNRKTGKPIWSHDLTKTHGAKAQTYGFATSPLVTDQHVIVLIGAEEAGIVAFDQASGKEAWRANVGSVAYQSPTMASFKGTRQLISIADKRIDGLNAATGKTLWTLEGNFRGSTHIVQTGDDSFVTYGWGGLTSYTVKEGADKNYTVEKGYESRQLKGSYAIPVFHKGYLYGYSGLFMSCVDAKTGEKAWRSRPPGKGSLILVNDTLVVFGVTGKLHLVDATPEAYRETASLKVFDNGSIVNPIIAGKQIYLRSMGAVAAVDLVKGKSAQVAIAKKDKIQGGAFASFLAELEKAEDKQARLDAFFEKQKDFPIVESGGRTWFVYRGEATDMGVHLAAVTRAGSDTMTQVPGTDLWYRGYMLDPNGRYDYLFERNLGENIEDELNKTPKVDQRMSQLVMPGWKEPSYLKDADAAQQGTLSEHQLKSTTMDQERKVVVYQPKGYAESKDSYPLVVVIGGTSALGDGMMKKALDHLMADGQKALVVFDHFPGEGRASWPQSVGPQRVDFAKYVGDELLPFVRENYRVKAGKENVSVMGTSVSGYGAMVVALANADKIGKLATQSIYIHNPPMARTLIEMVPEMDDKLSVHMAWSKATKPDPGENTDFDRDNQLVSDVLEKAGNKVQRNAFASGDGWGTWRAQYKQMFDFFLN